MAILTDADYRDLKKRILADPNAKAELKGWGLDRSTWMAVFQAVEDWFVGGFSAAPGNSFKAQIETITGPCTNSQAKQVGFVWMGWRYGANP